MINKILLITNKEDITTDFIVKNLKHQQISFYRLNTEEIGTSVELNFDFANGKYLLFDRLLGVCIDLLSIKAVYFRRPEVEIKLKGLTPGEIKFVNAEMLFVLEGLYKILDNVFWINKVFDIRNAENKIYQLLLAKGEGFEIPQSIITNIPDQANSFYQANSNKCIIKPIKSGMLEHETEQAVIYTSQVNLSSENLDRVSSCPVYLQNLIEKKGDVRVTIVGQKIFSAFIHSQEKELARVDWRKANESLLHTGISLPEKLEKQCLSLMNRLSLNFGAIDFILDQHGNYIFLEINPNGQWAWIEKQLNYPISDAITKLLVEEGFN